MLGLGARDYTYGDIYILHVRTLRNLTVLRTNVQNYLYRRYK